MPWRIPEADSGPGQTPDRFGGAGAEPGHRVEEARREGFYRALPVPRRTTRNPNFIVTPDKGLFHCMACGKAGNAIQFVQQHDGVSFSSRLRVVAAGQQRRVQRAQPHAEAMHRAASAVSAGSGGGRRDVVQPGGGLLSRTVEAVTRRTARAYLASRGLDSDELIDHFQIGFADRTLGLRLPDKNRKEGEALRSRLTQLGLWRDSGHEHFNGCIVVPLQDEPARS